MPLQTPQLDDRTASQLVSEVIARIPVHTPKWNNFNDSDPGMTLVQLFAFLAENLLYRANRVPEANRIKFLQLLGIGLQPPTPGHGLVTFNNERGPVQKLALDAGQTVLAGNVPFRTRNPVDVLPISAELFYKQPRLDLSEAELQRYRELYGEPEQDNVYYRTMPFDPPETGKDLPELNLFSHGTDTIDDTLWMALVAPRNVPLDAVRSVIGGQTLSIGICPALKVDGKTLEPKAAEVQQMVEPGLVFEIAAPAQPPLAGLLAPPDYEVLPIEYAEDVLNQPGTIRVTLPKSNNIRLWAFDPSEAGTWDYPPLIEDDELAGRIVTWIRIRLPQPDETGPQAQLSAQTVRLTWVGVNAVRVVQAVLVENERLGQGNGAPNQVFKVANTPVIVEEYSNTSIRCAFKLEIAKLNDEGWETWTQTDDLFAHAPDDPVYTLDPESGEVRFGDGLRGKRPLIGRAIRASYEYGGGQQGNVAIEAISKSNLPGGYRVSNPLRTWGASAGESTTDGERNIPNHLRHRNRLVTIEDFEQITYQTPGVDVGRVEVLPLFNPSTYVPSVEPIEHPGAVTVMVIPDYRDQPADPPQPDRLFLNTICRWLDQQRLATTEIFVRGPEYIGLWVTVGLTTMPGQMRARVHQAVQEAIRDYLSPLIGGLPTDGSPDEPGPGWPLRMEVRSQDLEAVAVRTDGVRYVKEAKLGISQPGDDELKPVNTVQLVGIELPWLMSVRVAEGDAPGLSSFQRRRDTASVNRKAVPTTIRKCQ